MIQKIFIGSSREQHDKQIVPILRTLLSDCGYRPIPWFEAFSSNEYTLNSLADAAKNCDAAVFVFGADDVLVSRESSNQVVRDNVLFEYGLFSGLLERQRVFILREEGVRVPSDLAGITRLDYNSQPGASMELELRRCVNQIDYKLQQMGPRDITVIDYYGLPETLQKYLFLAATVREFLHTRQREPQVFSRDPVYFDSYVSALEAYQQGLLRLKRRFWTTSFLHSGFWTGGDLPLRQNQELLSKARQQGAPVEMRRLLLLKHDHRSELEDFGKKIRMMHRLQQDAEIYQWWERLRTVKERHLRLEKEGCQTRVAYFDPRQARMRIGSHVLGLPAVVWVGVPRAGGRL